MLLLVRTDLRNVHMILQVRPHLTRDIEPLRSDNTLLGALGARLGPLKSSHIDGPLAPRIG